MCSIHHKMPLRRLVRYILGILVLLVVIGRYFRASTVGDLVGAIEADDVVSAKDLISSGLWQHKYVDPSGYWSFPIHIAAEHGNVTILRRLVEAGADPNAGDCWEKTPLMRICDGFNESKVIVGPECMKYLCSMKADVNKKASGYYDASALHLAARYGQIKYVELLIENGADVNAQMRDGDHDLSSFTALHQCGEWPGEKYLEVAKVLVKNGADLTLRNGKGLTPREFAAARGRTELVKFLEASEQQK